jgi:hydroxypyruvate reductase/glycerate 2-kinase
MSEPAHSLRSDALAIWRAALDAVRPEQLVRAALANPTLALISEITKCGRIIVAGAGKAGAAMASVMEDELAVHLERMYGWVNVPAETVRPLKRIHLHAARAAGMNQPTAEGVIGAEKILGLAKNAGPNDLLLCLVSGGGSALLPAPVEGVTLEDKQQTTLALHASGASIDEMNAVRKHLSRIKGGHLARVFAGRAVCSLIISDVVGDRLDVIASGPTASDPTTFRAAFEVLEKYHLLPTEAELNESAGSRRFAPWSVVRHLKHGMAGRVAETPKVLPDTVHNLVIGNNNMALSAAAGVAGRLGYRLLNWGSALEGETREVATMQARLVRSIREESNPVPAPVCILSGGETTVALSRQHGLGGRNQEFVLALINTLGKKHLSNIAILSGGTDGEDGPTDAAGAIADEKTLDKAETLGLDPAMFLNRHDSYHFFEASGDLLKPGLTQTNVMDVRIILVR